MKKIFFSGVILLGSLSFGACERTESSTSLEAKEEEDNTVVVDRDSVPTEYEVTETVVKYDTTTRTKTVEANVAPEEEK